MSAIALKALPYLPRSGDWFLRVRSLGDGVWLDSAHPRSALGRFDIISAAPLLVIDHHRHGDLFASLRTALAETFDGALTLPEGAPTLPFQGGAIGWIGYEIGRRLQGLPPRSDIDSGQSRARVGLYSWAIVSDHHERRTWLLVRPETPPPLRQAIEACLAGDIEPPRPFALTGPWRDDFPRPAYERAFARLQEYIRNGDCYQANLARRFCADFNGDPLSAYLRLRERAAAPFSAYLESASGDAVLSLSPERFLAAEGSALLTQPIKGTAARDIDPAIDAERARALLASDKNRAENLMIVDLLRNDLGRSCVPGSIRVDRLFELQSFATVHHLVSSVRGQLRPGLDALDALRNCFPGGSITGAPKHRAMQIIDELEPQARDVFCGAIGYISLCGRMDTNISIRTLLAREHRLLAWAGGGVVADSKCEEEFEETRSKIEPLLRVLSDD